METFLEIPTRSSEGNCAGSLLLDLIALRGQATATTLATSLTVSRQAVVNI
jgi:hypothetical protein